MFVTAHRSVDVVAWAIYNLQKSHENKWKIGKVTMERKTMGNVSMKMESWCKSVLKGQQALSRIGVWCANECR